MGARSNEGQGAGPPSGESAPTPGREVLGRAELRRVGRLRFPVFELTANGQRLALVGRFGWLNTFFGSGPRVELPDGEQWRIRSALVAKATCPVIFDARGRKIAVASLGTGNYGINGRDYACVLYPAEPRRLGKGNTWMLRRFEEHLAIVTRHPLAIEAAHPVPLAAAL